MVIRHFEEVLKRYQSNRVLSMDVFRGLTITAMILVNNPGSWAYVYSPLAHAEWHGWTPTDLIFPFFIFIVGWSCQVSLGAKRDLALAPHKILKDAIKRGLVLFLLGIFLALFYSDFQDPSFSWLEERVYGIRVMGVLQRIAIVYVICMFIILYCRLSTQVALSILLLTIYSVGIYFLPYANLDGVVMQGELSKGNTFANYLDLKLLGEAHIYQPAIGLFGNEPEGLWSTILAIVSALTGAWLARWMNATNHTGKNVLYLMMFGFLCTLSGISLDGLIPINKALWTPSFVLLSTGIACLIIAMLIVLIDIKHYKIWSAPFLVFGINSIAFFMFAGIVGRLLIMIPIGDGSLKSFLYTSIFQSMFGNYFGSFIFALAFLLVSYLLMYSLYKRNIIWKV